MKLISQIRIQIELGFHISRFSSSVKELLIANSNRDYWIDEIPFGFSAPFAPFVHPKPPLAGAGARPPIGTLLGERDRPGCRFRRRAENRFPN
jgi:hypothetical protein